MSPLPIVSREHVIAIVVQLLDGSEELLNNAEFIRATENPEIALLLQEIHSRYDDSPMPRSELIELTATAVYSILNAASGGLSAP